VVLELERLARVLVAATGVGPRGGFASDGLTVQQWRIHVILARAGALRLRDVAIALHASQPSASRLVRRLERTGLVERVPAPDDGRGILVRLTSDGWQSTTRLWRADGRCWRHRCAQCQCPATSARAFVLLRPRSKRSSRSSRQRELPSSAQPIGRSGHLLRGTDWSMSRDNFLGYSGRWKTPSE